MGDNEKDRIWKSIDQLTEDVKRTQDLKSSVAVLQSSVDNLADCVNDLKKEINTMKNEPVETAKRNRQTAISCVITTVVGFVVGILLDALIRWLA